jgi:peptidoglycan-associated lipoprotein
LDHTSLFENSGLEVISGLDGGAVAKSQDVEIPCADEIWDNGLDDDALDGFMLEQQKQRNTKSKQSDVPSGDKSGPLESEPQWGGVWWMSSEERERAAGEEQKKSVNKSAATDQSSVSANRQASRINVEENLSMPSMWVESCPEAATGRSSPPPLAKPPQHKLGSIIMRLVSWLGIILLIALFYSLFATQINQYFKDVQEHIVGIEAVGQSQPQALETERPSVSQLDEAELVSAQPVVEKPEAAQGQVAAVVSSNGMREEDLNQYPEDLSGDTVENVELATRYAVFFNFNKSTIPTKYVQLLRAIQYKMLAEEDTFLRIIGYADTQGDKSYNYRLSLKRADEVKQYFINRGIAGNRLHVTAIGAAEDEVKVLILNESAKRRRVEMILFPN